MAQIEIFVNEDTGVESVAVVMRESSILEYEGELVPALALTPFQARCLAHALNEKADEIDK